MEKIIEAKPKQQTYTIPKVEEQWTKSPCMIKVETVQTITDAKGKQTTETVTITKPLTDMEGLPLRLSEAKVFFEQITKQASSKTSAEDLEKVTALADTYVPEKETVTVEELEQKLKAQARWGVGCKCGRFYTFQAKTDLSGFQCLNGYYNEGAGLIFCDNCGEKIRLVKPTVTQSKPTEPITVKKT